MTGVVAFGMAIGHSKVTSQGQISIPAEIRRRLGAEAGSTLEWDEDGGQIVVRRSGQVSSEELHRAVFGRRAPIRKTLKQLKEGLSESMRKRHARG
jgi:antitoxin PrlF